MQTCVLLFQEMSKITLRGAANKTKINLEGVILVEFGVDGVEAEIEGEVSDDEEYSSSGSESETRKVLRKSDRTKQATRIFTVDKLGGDPTYRAVQRR